MTPDVIAGRYQVLRPVGRGGMGTVWLCRDEVLGREVAVKQVGAFPGESATDAARALREARSSAALNHRNVVSVFDVVDTDDGRAWLVMEYVPSRTLGEIVRQDGPLDPRRAAWIGAQVAEGLAAAHALGTIHRDVKPGNILVSTDDVAKISDFGIARGADDEQLTRTGLVTGTPSYFSPELARGEDAGPESDVYALGATLYTAVEGHAPYPEKRNPIALLQMIASEEPQPPSHAGPLMVPIQRMMDRDPASRWSMADAATALRRVAEERDVGDEPTAVLAAPFAGLSREHDEWQVDRPTRGGAVPIGRDRDGTAARPPTGPRPAHDDGRHDRRRLVPWLVGAAFLLLLLLVGGYLMLSGDSTDRSPQAPESSPSEPSDEPRSRQTEDASPEASPTRSPTPSPSESRSPRQQPPAADQGQAMESAASEYFGLVPSDTDAGWARLSPSMQQEVGRGKYEEFWSSIQSVELQQAEAVEGQPQVDVVLTYFFKDGTVKEESQRLTMERGESGYLIDGDEVTGSRTVG